MTFHLSGGGSLTHLVQSPVGAQSQQIVVLSLQNLTCLKEGTKKIKHNTFRCAETSYF